MWADLRVVLSRKLHLMESLQRGRLVEVINVLADMVLRYFSARQPKAEVSLDFKFFILSCIS